MLRRRNSSGSIPVAFASRHNELLLGVAPLAAACNSVSLAAGEIVNLPGPHDSIMAGLNCGLASEIAWPVVSGHLDLALAITLCAGFGGKHA